MFPIIGVTMQIHHSKYKYSDRFYAVKYSVWEAVYKATTDFVINL